MDAVTETKARRPRQLRLFPVTNPLSERLGDPFFRALPQEAGVYFFYDEADRLLYIGQSNNLRARVGSYRHVNLERHARRTVRLVHRVRRIAWETCNSPQAAIERERELLLERRPPFNRAGVWQAPPWWLCMEVRKEAIQLSVVRGLVDSETVPPVSDSGGSITRFGPHRASFPFIYAALVRAALRLCRPSLDQLGFPAGFLNDRLVAEVLLRSGPDTAAIAGTLSTFLTGLHDALLPPLDDDKRAPFYGNAFEQQLRAVDEELLREFHERLKQ